MPDSSDTNSEERVKAALMFAKELAELELANIDRVHRRTLQYISALGVAFTFLLGVLAFFGYANLRGLAVAVAKKQMQAEVNQQVQEKLTKENIEKIVQDQVRSYSTTEMQGAIHSALTMPAQAQMIRAAAADEARNQIKQQFAPRHFSNSQSDALVKAIDDQPQLDGYPVEVLPSGFSLEAGHYAQEIRASVARTKLKIVTNFTGFQASPIEGVAIYRDKAAPDIFARKLQQAFHECGIDVPIIAAPSPPANFLPAGEKVPLVIFVGVRF